MSFLWLLPVIFIIHDLEEILMVEKWLAANKAKVNMLTKKYKLTRIAGAVIDITQKQFAGAVAVEFIIITVAAAFSFFYSQSPAIMFVYVCFNTALFLHVFMHVAQSLFLKSYTPGVITAVVILIPGSLVIYSYLLKTGSADFSTFYYSIPVGAVMILPMVLGALFIGKKLFK